MPPPDFQAGQELTSALLNEWSATADAGVVSPDASSGLVGISLPSGSGYAIQRKAEGWFVLAAAPSGSPSGSYQITEQVDLPNGAFADGVMVRIAFPTPGSATPVLGKVVRAWKDRASWRFEWGSC